MTIFIDLEGNEHIAQTTIKVTHAVNGELSISGTIVSNEIVLASIDRGWRLRFGDEYFFITYQKLRDQNKNISVEFDAVHQFFWDFSKSAVYETIDGSTSLERCLEMIFKNSGYRYVIDPKLVTKSFVKQNFGMKDRLSLFNNIITAVGAEFNVVGKVISVYKEIGTDLSTVVRKRLNLNELTVTRNVGKLITYQKGFGKWTDEEDHSKGRLEVEYESPLASIYGRLEGAPVTDERYTVADNLLEVIKKNVEDSYTLSIELSMEDLTKAGYAYAQPHEGDYITVIDEECDFKERVRIVSYTSSYDSQGRLIDHQVTCNDIGTVKKQSAEYTSLVNKVNSADKSIAQAIELANFALVSADGKSTNYYGTEFPQDIPKGTLHVGDLFYQQNGDKVIMYVWNGHEWVADPVVNDLEALSKELERQFSEVNETMEANEAERQKQIDDLLLKADTNKSLAEEAKSISDQAKLDATTALSSAQVSKDEAIAEARRLDTIVRQDTETKLSTAKSQAIEEAAKLVDDAKGELSERLLFAETEITKTNDEIKTLAKKSELDTVNNRLSSTESSVTQTAEGVKQLSTQITETDSKMTNAETKINQLVGEVSSKVSQTDFNKLNNTVSSQATTLSQQANQILLKADKSYVDNVNKLVSQNSASLSMLSDAIEARVLKSDFDTVTGRMTSAETTIKTIASQIDTKLSRTDADKIVTNAITQSERGTIQRISEVEGKIPTEVGGVNLLLNSDFAQTATGSSFTVNNQTYSNTAANWVTFNPGIANAQISYHAYITNLNGRKNVIAYNEYNSERNWKGIYQNLGSRMPQTTNDFVLSLDVFVSDVGTKLFGGFYYVDKTGSYNFYSGYFRFDTNSFDVRKWQRVSIAVPFEKEKADFTKDVRFYIYAYNFSTNAILAIDDVKLETGKIATGHSLAPEEFATTAAVHEIKQTVDGYSRTIFEQGNSISQVIQTAQGLVSRVENLSIGSRNLLKGTKDLSTTDRPQYVTTDKYLDFAIARTSTVAGSTHDTYRATTTTSLTATEYVATFYARASRDGAVVLNHFYNPNTTLTGISSTNPMRTATDGAVYLTLTTEWQRYWIKWTQTPTDVPKTVIIGRNQSSTDATVEIAGVALYEGNTPQDWSPAPEDSEVPLNTVKTEVSQLAGSWAVRNLTSSGTVLNQLNLNRDGSVKIDGKLVQITGTTYIQDGVITSAKIANLDATKITTGTLNAANVNIVNLNANKLVGLDANFIRSKIELAMIDWLKGKTITAQNNAMRINLNDANITFNSNATINFNSAYNALVRRKGTHTAFVHFNDVSASSDGGVGSLYASIGVTSSGDGINSQSSGRFAGLRVFRGARGTEHNATVDQAEIYGDKIILKDDFSYNRGFVFRPTTLKNGDFIDMNYLVGAVRALSRCWIHWNNVSWNPASNDLRIAVVREYNNYMKDL